MSEQALPENGIVTSTATVIQEWLDYNDHMNVAYYIAVFDLGIDAFKATVGLDMDYIAQAKRSTVALEAHITYQLEAALGEELQVETRILDFDGKRCHLYQEMYRDEDLLSTQETLSISFDTAARKSCDFEPHLAARYEEMQKRQQAIPVPKWVGGSVGIRRKKAAS